MNIKMSDGHTLLHVRTMCSAYEKKKIARFVVCNVSFWVGLSGPVNLHFLEASQKILMWVKDTLRNINFNANVYSLNHLLFSI
jgi:hypothetical protein